MSLFFVEENNLIIRVHNLAINSKWRKNEVKQQLSIWSQDLVETWKVNTEKKNKIYTIILIYP